MDATTTDPCASRPRADHFPPRAFRRGRADDRLVSRGLKSGKAGQFGTNPLQLCDPRDTPAASNVAFFRYLGRVAERGKSRAVAWDLISCRFSHSGRAYPPPVGKGVSDSGQRQAFARVSVVRGAFRHARKPDPPKDDPRQPNEPPDTPETPPDEPPPTLVEEPPPRKGPYVAGLDPG